jgi:hypothetical protein
MFAMTISPCYPPFGFFGQAGYSFQTTMYRGLEAITAPYVKERCYYTTNAICLSMAQFFIENAKIATIMKLPDPIQNVADELSNLPSIGPRQAIRLAFYLVGEKTEDVHKLAVNINNLRKLKICKHCFFPHQNASGLCDICGNPNRNQNVIMIVEKETDLISLENTKKFTGRYFITGPIPKTGLL